MNLRGALSKGALKGRGEPEGTACPVGADLQSFRIEKGYESVDIEPKGPHEVGLTAGPILHCSASGASCYTASRAHRLYPALKERMLGGEADWQCYEDLGQGGADARFWAEKLFAWRGKHTDQLQWNQERGRMVSLAMYAL